MEPFAIWESRGGRYFVHLFETEYGFKYNADGAGGHLAASTRENAITEIKPRLNDFQPDANKTPMRRIL